MKRIQHTAEGSKYHPLAPVAQVERGGLFSLCPKRRLLGFPGTCFEHEEQNGCVCVGLWF